MARSIPGITPRPALAPVLGAVLGAVSGLAGRRRAATACFLLGWLLLLGAALSGQAWAFAVAVAVSHVTDWQFGRCNGQFDATLRTARFSPTVRFALRQMLLLLLLVRAGAPEALTSVAAVAFVAYYLLQVPQSVLLHRVRDSRVLPVATRNIDLSGLGLRDDPPRALMSKSFLKSMHTDLLAMAGLLAAVVTGVRWLGYLGCLAMTVLCLGYALALARLYAPARTMPTEQQALDHVDAWLRAQRPAVMLYFSGTKGSAYQVNMWLRTLEGTGRRPLVLLRERHILERLEPTPLPVLCLPSSTHVMNRDLSSVRLVLYPANVGPNIHVLRMPQAEHVFIGHGDSDKVASINPYAKVYDHLWTAGRAGRDRWATADVGVRDSAITEVGRPPLEDVRTGPRPADGSPLTVLYAPTWEGWTEEPGATSLTTSGRAIVELLLSLPTPVRVLYKPHPYTGIRSSAARKAHRATVAALDAANRERARERTGRPAGAVGAPEQESARAELRAVEKELTALRRRFRKAHTDDVERSRESCFTAADAARREELGRAREELLWRSTEPWRHRHITPQGPRLYSCFNACDLLVSDVSSVVSDFMASEKPYAVADVQGLGDEEFRRRNPTAGAAYLLSRDARELGAVVEQITAPEPDAMAGARGRLREYLLGPPSPDAATRFDAAVTALLPADHPHPADDTLPIDPQPALGSALGSRSER